MYSFPFIKFKSENYVFFTISLWKTKGGFMRTVLGILSQNSYLIAKTLKPVVTTVPPPRTLWLGLRSWSRLHWEAFSSQPCSPDQLNMEEALVKGHMIWEYSTLIECQEMLLTCREPENWIQPRGIGAWHFILEPLDTVGFRWKP